MARKPDVVIEAARYKNGQIVMVRAYERRGATFSDHVLIERKTLVERLQKGERLAVGSREELKASTFKLGSEVQLVKQNDHEWISTRPDATSDTLDGAPVF
jgi:hypothetical protein